MADIAIVDYGMGNLRSVSKALEHVAPAASVVVTSDPAVVHKAGRVVFPGQGAMPDCMRELDARGLRAAVLEAGAHFLLTVKGNQKTVKDNIEKLVSAPDADFPPSRADADPIPHPGNQQKPNGEPIPSNSARLPRANWIPLGGAGRTLAATNDRPR